MRPILSAVLSITLSVGLTMLLRRILAVAGESAEESGTVGRPSVAYVLVVVMPVAVGNSPTLYAAGKRRRGGPPFMRKRSLPGK
jgi:hypothetical protein